MRCHYDILGISMDSTTEDVKRAYRKLALEWHPDKNLHQLQEATEQFQLIQQAYDVLSDSQERAWYDRHRDAILKGGLEDDYKDSSVNVFQYFNTSCFSGYGDDDKSFYAVYQDVFDQIAAEDQPFIEDESIEIPRFGNAHSPYDEVVHPFYSYWQSYCTHKPYFWIEKYDIREAPNRRVLRLIEKENKKVRDQAKKKRNEEVRHLVEYVRKRDKRVQAYKLILEEKSAENTRKMEQERRRQILERQKNFENYKETEWASMSQLEGNLQEIEAQLDKEFGNESNEKGACEEENSDSNDNSDDIDDLYCMACDKAFRSDKAFINHERSKKHKENVTMLKEVMKDEDECFIKGEAQATTDNFQETNEFSLATDFDNEYEDPVSRKGKKKKQKKTTNVKNDTHSDQEETEQQAENLLKSMKQPDQLENSVIDSSVNTELKENEHLEDGNKTKNKKSKGQKKSSKSSKESGDQITCVQCHTKFASRNKLFDHLKTTGHAVYVPSSKHNKEVKPSVQEKPSHSNQKRGKR